MNDDNFNELAGRIQALADFTLHLAAMLEVNEVIDGKQLTETLHRFADDRQLGRSYLEQSKNALHELAQYLDDARESRQ